jgi:hypothetical protein
MTNREYNILGKKENVLVRSKKPYRNKNMTEGTDKLLCCSLEKHNKIA